MTYATVQDLVDRFGERELVQLTDRTNRPPTTIDSVVVDRGLADAAAFIDGYVGKAYSLPLPIVPPALVKICADVARYYLHGKAAEPDGAVERAYLEGRRWLTDLSKGLVQIDIGGMTPPQPGGGSVRALPSTRLFSRDTLRGA